MEQIPTWLNDAVHAAGLAAVYNADDWEAIVENAGTTLHPTTPLAPQFPH
jgi:hypothetical protein